MIQIKEEKGKPEKQRANEIRVRKESLVIHVKGLNQITFPHDMGMGSGKTQNKIHSVKNSGFIVNKPF